MPPFIALPLLLADQHGGDLGAFGAMIGSYGAANLIAMLVIGSARHLPEHRYLIFSGNWLIGSGIGLIGLLAMAGAGLPSLMLGTVLAALGGPLFSRALPDQTISA